MFIIEDLENTDKTQRREKPPLTTPRHNHFGIIRHFIYIPLCIYVSVVFYIRLYSYLLPYSYLSPRKHIACTVLQLAFLFVKQIPDIKFHL